MSSGTGNALVIIQGRNFADGRLAGVGDACYLFGDASDNGHHFPDTSAFTSDPLRTTYCDRVGLQLITVNDDDGSPMTGDWKVEVSNDVSPAANAAVFGQVAGNAGNWSDITSAFSPAIAAVTTTSNQYVQADVCVRALRITFTPTP